MLLSARGASFIYVIVLRAAKQLNPALHGQGDSNSAQLVHGSSSGGSTTVGAPISYSC